MYASLLFQQVCEGVTFLSVMLSTVMKPNTSSGSSSSLSSGTSACCQMKAQSATRAETSSFNIKDQCRPWWHFQCDFAGWWCPSFLTCLHEPSGRAVYIKKKEKKIDINDTNITIIAYMNANARVRTCCNSFLIPLKSLTEIEWASKSTMTSWKWTKKITEEGGKKVTAIKN